MVVNRAGIDSVGCCLIRVFAFRFILRIVLRRTDVDGLQSKSRVANELAAYPPVSVPADMAAPGVFCHDDTLSFRKCGQ
jgi:hypothetical protein